MASLPRDQAIVRIRCRVDGPLVVEVQPSPPAGFHPGSPAPDGATPGHGQSGSPEAAAVQLLVTDHEGNPFPLPAHKRFVALCRCGQTRSRPFCDGSHKESGFKAADLAGPPACRPAQAEPAGKPPPPDPKSAG